MGLLRRGVAIKAGFKTWWRDCVGGGGRDESGEEIFDRILERTLNV